MPDLNTSATPAGVPRVGGDTAARGADDAYDIALGCECADPVLQIERWLQETAAPGAARETH